MPGELKLPVALALVIALAAGCAKISRGLRGELDKSARYAKVIAACANGESFKMHARMFVQCYPTELTP